MKSRRRKNLSNMKIFILLFSYLFFYQLSWSQESTSELEKIKKEVTENAKKLSEVKVKMDTLQSKVTQLPKPCKECLTELKWLWLYVLLPVILFIFFGLYFIRWLKRDGYKLADALSGDLTTEQLNTLQTAVNNNPVFTANPVLNRSSSRLIAFLSSLSAVIMAICLFSYYMYFVIKGLNPPEFEKLWTILAAIGIGVVPYASKVISQNSNSSNH